MATSRPLVLAAVLLGTAFAAGAAGADPRGEALYGLCAQCHGSAGEGRQLFLAPAIAGLPEWYVDRQLHNFKGGLRGIHPEDVGGLRMHPMSLWLKSDEDIAAVSAYVASLEPVVPEPVLEGGDASRGQSLYAPCQACHGPGARGNEVLNAPPLVNASDWYLLSTLGKYKAGIRGSNPANQNALVMRGMALQLPDEQAMKDVVAYIMSLRDGAGEVQ